MIAAIYARKSTDQSDRADDAKSVARQVDHARAYATRKGWAVDDAFVFVDDNISGAEFSRRPGFLRLMNSLKPAPRFQVLVMSEESRLGRESIETAYALKQLVQGGVRVFFYLEDRERTLDSPTDKIMLSLTAFADELEREKARQRTYDAMLRKAQAGHVTGGRLFGYDNVDIPGPNGQRSHVERRINDVEAAIVRRIFELSAAGTGYTRIAKTLNAERAVSPRAQQGRPSGWAPTTVKEVLDRPIYRGTVVWNRTRKRNQWGQHRASARPRTEWLTREAPELRIVPEPVWQAVHRRRAGVREQLQKASGGRRGARVRDVESHYLLPGFARCGACGGALGVRSRDHGGRRAYFYGCLIYAKRGPAVCGNRTLVPMDRVDAAVLETLAGQVLKPAVVDAVVAGVLEALAPETQAQQAQAYRVELASVEAEIARLTQTIAITGPLPALVEAITERHAAKQELVSAIITVEAQQRGVDKRTIERKIRAKLADWRGLLTRNVQDGRSLMREVLAGPLRFTPDGACYRFEGRAAIGRLLEGVIPVSTYVASPRGSIESGFVNFQGIAA